MTWGKKKQYVEMEKDRPIIPIEWLDFRIKLTQALAESIEKFDQLDQEYDIKKQNRYKRRENEQINKRGQASNKEDY